MEKPSKTQRLNELRHILWKKHIAKRFRLSINRNIYKALTDFNKIANDPSNKNPDAVMEAYNHSVYSYKDEGGKNKKLMMFFVFKMNQSQRNLVLSESEKFAIVEEAEELARDK
ncbi:MAG: hypothetical protein L6308_02805 [Candidatus Omnitrophica bacterium]|nr:hypothetical protein [Candidatus Omnitrophota bacterium]